MELQGNTILITGGNSGIGYELARQFHGLGNKIIITGRNEERLRQAQQELPGLEIFKYDLASPLQTNELMAFLQKNYPNLNILINNAGIQHNYTFSDESELNFKIEEEIRVNLTAPLQLSGLCLPLLLQNQNAAIVNISSALGLVPKQSAPVYGATKAGIHIFSKALRYQLENSPVKVFEIIPSLIDTPMTQGRGSSKISPQVLVQEFLKAFEKDKYEISIGKVKALRIIHRLLPGVADRMLRRS